MFDSIGHIFAIASTMVGALGMLAGIIWGSGWLVFKAIEMILRLFDLYKLLVEFVVDRNIKKYNEKRIE